MISEQLSGGEAVVKSLIKQQISILFGLPGVQNDWLYNALYDHRDQIEVIHTRHEQGAGYMALGYAMATGGEAVYNVVPGPGFLNSAAALATAYGLNAKVLCLVGQIPSHQIGQRIGVLHEIEDQLGILGRLTKWAKRIDSPAEAPNLVDEAFRQMRSGRPRPVGLEIPMDVLERRMVVDLEETITPPFQPPIDYGQIETAARWLGKARNPMIFTGGGAQGVSEGVTALADMLQAPVVGYRTGKGVLDGRHYLALEMPQAHEYWKKVDVVLAVGTNLRIPATWGNDGKIKIIRIDADSAAHNRLFNPDLAITGLAENVVPALADAVPALNMARDSREQEMNALHRFWAERTAFLEFQNSYLKLIREELGEDGILLDELTQVGFAARINYPVYKPRTFISTGYQGTLGWGFATGLGVKVARPTERVVSLAGDGGFLFTVQELATAVQHRIGLVTLLFNNNSYGNVQQMQKTLYDGRVIATDLVNPDFVKLAEAFGANGYRAETIEQCRAAMRAGFESDLPTVIEIPTGDLPSVDRFRRLGRVR